MLSDSRASSHAVLEHRLVKRLGRHLAVARINHKRVAVCVDHFGLSTRLTSGLRLERVSGVLDRGSRPGDTVLRVVSRLQCEMDGSSAMHERVRPTRD